MDQTCSTCANWLAVAPPDGHEMCCNPDSPKAAVDTSHDDTCGAWQDPADFAPDLRVRQKPKGESNV